MSGQSCEVKQRRAQLVAGWVTQALEQGRLGSCAHARYHQYYRGLSSHSLGKIFTPTTVIMLPAHHASFGHSFVSGMQSFYFSESLIEIFGLWLILAALEQQYCGSRAATTCSSRAALKYFVCKLVFWL